MSSATEPGPAAKLLALAATAAIALLVVGAGPVGFMRALIVGVPALILLVALIHLAGALRNRKKNADVFIPSGRSLRLKKSFSPTSQTQAHWTVTKDDHPNEDPFHPKPGSDLRS